MCTVTYIPHQSGFVLTSNRDEQPGRSPQHITRQKSNGNLLLFPKDTAAGGTWIAVSDKKRLLCVLNGAFKRHLRKPVYPKSRGIMALEFFHFSSASDFLKNYDFNQMEPFTLIICENKKLLEVRRDENRTFVQNLDPAQNHIWSSATLYTEEVRKKREGWFANWLSASPDKTPDSILQFHRTTGEGDPGNDLVMDRNGLVQTVSITQIIVESSKIDMRYYDLLNEQSHQQEIFLTDEMLEKNKK